MIQSNALVPALFAALLGVASTGCLHSEPPATDPSSAPAAAVTKPEGAADSVNATPGSGNTGSNGSPGPEGGPGSLGAGIGSGSGTGTGAGPGNTTSSATSR
jgi:hypothetical protein